MRQRGKAKTKGRSPGLHEEHHCQRQGRRGRLIWQSRSQQIVTFLGLGLIKSLKQHKYFPFINACLLILGTSIGVGMLGMPVELGKGGLVPGSSFLLLTWAASLVTGLLFLEVLSHVNKDVNFATLSEKIIGAGSKVYLVIVYLLLFLSLLFAYVKGGGVFLSDIFSSIPTWLGTLIFLAVFLPFILKGPKIIGSINALLILPMLISFVLLLILGFKEINFENYAHQNWVSSYLSSPLLVTSFGFHIILPTLFVYLNKNKTLLRRAIIVGTTTTMIIYLLWNAYILGVVPLQGEISLSRALQLDQTAVSPLKKIIGSLFTAQLAQVFYFCALTTSFLGVGLSTIDFSMDALKLKNTAKNRMLIAIFVFVPALILSSTNLRLFYLSIKFGAALACVLLLILFPAVLCMRLKLRQRLVKKGVAAALAFASLIVIAQWLNLIS
jgi:tyrosine-specific transport protein